MYSLLNNRLRNHVTGYFTATVTIRNRETGYVTVIQQTVHEPNIDSCYKICSKKKIKNQDRFML